MNLDTIEIPEVKANPARPRFYNDDNGRPMIELSMVGSKDTVVRRVRPDDMANYKPDWDAFCDGRPPQRRQGTPLTDVPGIDQSVADGLIYRNVHTAEELAALNDGQCQVLGHGMITKRKLAQNILHQRRQEIKLQAMKSVGTPASEAPPSAPVDIAEIKDQISNLAGTVEKLAQLVLAQQEKPRRGRPPKS